MIRIVTSAVTALAIATTSLSAMDSAASEQEVKSGFFDRFHFKGDLRVRHEIIEKDGSADKNRERFRFRYGMNVDITDDILVETAISTGKYSPTSGNVTFRDDENIQNYFMDTVKIDVADIKYSFGNSWVKVGKSKLAVYKPIKTQLTWDGDLRVEGINYGYKDSTSMITLGANRIHREKGNKDGSNINMFIAQYVQKLKVDDAKVNLGAAYYYYDGVKGNTTPYGKGNGNTLDGSDLYTEDYGIAEGFAEIKYKDLMGKPFKTALTVVYNTQASKDNFGYDIGAQLGSAKKVGQWQVAAGYRDVEKDAVFAAHSDSDFGGGGTDSKGYFFKAKHHFAKNVYVAGWWHWSKLGDTNVDYHRSQLDLILKF